MKVIYRLQLGGEVRGTEIAKALDVSRPTVSVSLKNLEGEGYLVRKTDRTVCLTPKGLRVALEIADRNVCLYEFLVRLGVERSVAETDACELEHALSRESYEALMSFAAMNLNEQTV